MSDFPSWQGRLVRAGGIVPSRVHYARSPAIEDRRVIPSVREQISVIERTWGPAEPAWLWVDAPESNDPMPPGLLDLVEFCTSNLRPSDKPGRVECLSPSRFGGILGPTLHGGVPPFVWAYMEIEKHGWEVHFATLKRLGYRPTDVMNAIMCAGSDELRARRRQARRLARKAS